MKNINKWLNKIHQGNTLDLLKQMPDSFVDTIVTSPPYWGLRDYGSETNTIWGGDTECKHEWEEKRTPRPNSSSGKTEYAKQKLAIKNKENFQEYTDYNDRATYSNFCKKCGAWYGQLGLEPDINLYIDHIVQITKELKRVLKPTGVMWWNHGDCYGGSGMGTWKNPPKEIKSKEVYHIPYGSNVPSRKNRVFSKCLMLQNYRLILKMVDEQDWILRNQVVWYKRNGMPSSVNDRLSNKWEPVFMFVKNNKPIYYYNVKTGLMADKKPLKDQQKEGVDWRWEKVGENYSESNTKILPEDAEKLNLPRARVYREKKMKKVSYWHSIDYFFDLDTIRTPYTEELNRWGGERLIAKGKSSWDKETGQKTYRDRDMRPNKNGKNPGDVFDIPTQPFSGTHFACVDDKTECLALSGWKKWNELKEGELIASFDMEEQVLKYEPLIESKIYNYDGEMIQLKTLSTDMLLTPNHRCVSRRYNSRKHKLGKYRIVIAEDLTNREHIPVYEEWKEGTFNLLPSPSKEFAELLGWIIAEGHVSKKERSIHIYQSLTANPDKCKRIEFLLENTKIRYYKRIDKKKYYRVKNGQKTDELCISKIAVYTLNWLDTRKILGIIPGKKFTHQMLLWSKEALEGLFNGFVKGDRYTKADKRIAIIQKDKLNVDIFQAICLRLGKRAIVSKRKEDLFVIYITNKKYITTVTTNGKSAIKKVHYKGVVWCPRVLSGTWIARRNGKMFITGNTFPKKLISPMIEATCPQWICKKCGKPRVRIIKTKQDKKPSNYRRDGRGIMGRKENQHGGLSGYKKTNFYTTGWTDCGCNTTFEPGIVLDPFVGSGTTAVVAKELGRNFIGIEINPNYINMAKKRLSHVATHIDKWLDNRTISNNVIKWKWKI